MRSVRGKRIMTDSGDRCLGVALLEKRHNAAPNHHELLDLRVETLECTGLGVELVEAAADTPQGGEVRRRDDAQLLGTSVVLLSCSFKSCDALVTIARWRLRAWTRLERLETTEHFVAMSA